MEKETTKSSKLIKVDLQGLNPKQVMLLKRINSLLLHIMSTHNEEDYFESSSNLMRFVATAIKSSNFNENSHDIEHDQQVLEFCVDILADQVYTKSVEHLDN